MVSFHYLLLSQRQSETNAHHKTVESVKSFYSFLSTLFPPLHMRVHFQSRTTNPCYSIWFGPDAVYPDIDGTALHGQDHSAFVMSEGLFAWVGEEKHFFSFFQNKSSLRIKNNVFFDRKWIMWYEPILKTIKTRPMSSFILVRTLQLFGSHKWLEVNEKFYIAQMFSVFQLIYLDFDSVFHAPISHVSVAEFEKRFFNWIELVTV